MWNKQMSEDEDDSWEVRAFEEDTTGNLLGCTWPPRSYTCTFCWREFQSAQALGGHMNVHRRQRARLQQTPPFPLPPTTVKPSSSTLLVPNAQEFLANGLCLLYALPNPNTILVPTHEAMDLPCSLYPISPFTTNKSNDTATNCVVSPLCQSTKTEPSASNSNDNNNHAFNEKAAKDSAIEELDLELRLGQRPP